MIDENMKKIQKMSGSMNESTKGKNSIWSHEPFFSARSTSLYLEKKIEHFYFEDSKLLAKINVNLRDFV